MKKKKRNKRLMKLILNIFWVSAVAGAIFVVAWHTFPDKKNRLEFIEDKIKEVQEQRKILTDKEKELEQLATEQEWEEVDNDNNK